MKHGTRWKLELFAENTIKAKRGLGLNIVMTKRLVALLYALNGKPIDHAAVMNSYAIVKDGSSVLSAFRGNMSICIAAMLSLEGNPKALFDHTVAVYGMMKDAGFWRSDFLAVAAYMVASNTDPENYRATVARMRSFYEGMKAQQWLYTGADDSIFAATLALSEVDIRQGVDGIGRLYELLGPGFLAKNSVQMLAQIMVAGGRSDPAAAERVLALRNAFRAQKMPLDKAYTLPSLGVLALLPADVNVIVQDIREAMALLRSHKGFGAFSVSKQEILLYASAVTASGYNEDVEGDIVTAAASTAIINIIIAMQTAMCAAAAGGAAAASSG
ncbi:MAG: DUF4003 domain-containing protein [Methanomassiliicoccaceae archaeon]|nr:DUF4003 domain-containing protein [Methanomassiliicoccaceae archaeon]